ncbi:MAG: PDZ domain-containing protein [Bacteroides sp.]|nr:PDZ domain-containing protein [Bacteroides sp.]MDE7470012.1 PDZ domain-containing protein [Paramuribaculum sp.]
MKKYAVYLATAALALSAALPGRATRSKKVDVARNLEIFNEVVKQIQMAYVDSIDIEKAINTAIDAMLSDLDPYTEYMPRKEQTEFRTMTTGEYGGIGSYIRQTPRGTIIAGPQENSPAAIAGLKAGDLILTIDGDTVTGLTNDKVSERLKGTPGTHVNVRVIRPFVEDSILDFDIERKKITNPAVPYYGVTHDNIGYIALTGFNEKSGDEVKAALQSLTANPEVKGLILDLRGNVGGLLEEAVEIVGYFVPKGTEVLRTRGKGVLNEKIYRTTSRPIVSADMPLVVLVDGGTASSSEITAGALQDLDRAVIAGSRSFGKGLVQTTYSMPYEGMLKVTTAKYYIPSGRLIQAIDYSHRNPDGSAGRIPDSLTNEFTTANGRKVRDGGGIVPDVKVDYPDISRLTYNVVRDNWAADYAMKYAATHPTIAAPEEFVITDEIYEGFKESIDSARFNYDKVCEQMLKNLREAAKVEGYMNDSVSAEFDRLNAMLKHSLSHDLDANRSSIEPYLAREIIGLYYYTKGEIMNSLKKDPGVDAAAAVLKDPARYRELLSPKAVKAD